MKFKSLNLCLLILVAPALTFAEPPLIAVTLDREAARDALHNETLTRAFIPHDGGLAIEPGRVLLIIETDVADRIRQDKATESDRRQFQRALMNAFGVIVNAINPCHPKPSLIDQGRFPNNCVP